MAQTASPILPPEMRVPEFHLKDTNSNYFYSFDALRGQRGTLVMFICNSCPYVLQAIAEILKVANDYRVQGIGMIAVSSNDAIRFPQDAPTEMTEFAFRNKIDFPYLYDENQQFAKALDVQCTPDFYLFDATDKLFYHGRIDDSRPGNNITSSGTDLRSAIDALLYNRTLATPQKPSIGCSIKWK
jgi:peroxiredoxin